MSTHAQSPEGERDEALNSEVATAQSAGHALIPSPPGLSSDLLAGILRMSAENSALHAKAYEQLSIENARLRQELAALRNPIGTLATEPSPVVDDFPKFTYFPRLPPELRRKVWTIVSHHPRVLEVRAVASCEGEEVRHSFQRFKILHQTVPAVVHVNQESRNEALRYYKLGSLNSRQYKTYLNIESDILYLQFMPDEYDFVPCQWFDALGQLGWGKHQVRRIAIPSNMLNLLEGEDEDTSQLEEVVADFAALGVTEILLVDQTYAPDRTQKNWRGSRLQESILLSSRPKPKPRSHNSESS